MEIEGYKVDQVINFTDFGHLTSDGDVGEDKMAIGLKNESLEPTIENMHKLGEKYAHLFLNDLNALNVETAGTHFPYASQFIKEQVELIKRLESKEFIYKTSDGLYFDTSKDADYGKLGNVGGDESRIGENSEKKNSKDFAVWKFGEKGWPSPWGTGFPGWHIECSAMILSLLGEEIDIHTGGVEHISVHHNNEIAQAESATDKVPFSKYWLHRAHLQIDNRKIAKSEGNVVYLKDITDKGYSPLAFRYLLLQSHYSKPTNFTWEALDGAQIAYRKLKEFVSTLPEGGKISTVYNDQFKSALEDDLNTPLALGVVWNLVKDDTILPADKYATLLEFDKVLGFKLGVNEFELKEIPSEIQKLIKEREEARKNKDFAKSDELREEILKRGFVLEDTTSGPKLSKS